MTTLTPLVLSHQAVNETLESHDEGYIKILSPFSLIANIIRKSVFFLLGYQCGYLRRSSLTSLPDWDI